MTKRADETFDFLPVLVLTGLTLNGLMVTIMRAFESGDGPALLLGVGPFQLATIVIAVTLFVRAPDAPPRNPWLELPAIGLALVPSSAIAWATLCAYAAYLAWRTRGAQRIAVLLFVALGATSLWSAIGLNWFAGLITTFEALMVANFLSFATDDISWNGNVVGITNGFSLIVLPACASADLVPKALVALAAIVAFFDTAFDRRFLRIAALTALLLVVGNWTRLAAMAVSAEQYDLIHGPLGANLFDLYQSMLIVAAGYLLIEPAEHPNHA